MCHAGIVFREYFIAWTLTTSIVHKITHFNPSFMWSRFSSRLLLQEIKFTEKAKAELKFQQEREHHASKLGETWKKLSIFICVPVILVSLYNAYNREKAHLDHFHKSDKEYEYLTIRKKPFPFGDGTKSFFHHDKYNIAK